MPKPAQSDNGPSLNGQTINGVSMAPALYERSGAAAYGLSAERFAAILDEILRKHIASNPTADANQHADFCSGLRLEELALARACAQGSERAWHDFVSRYRQKLHSMALHITRDSAHAAELADSLFADLYGVNVRAGVRHSKLVFYNGRGSLEGWLRTVMAQEFINRYRKQKRNVSLEEQIEEGVQFAAPASLQRSSDGMSDGASDRRLEAATDEALAELSAEDRFTLASYYLDGRTLAEIARTLGLHESSVSRRLDRLATGLRKRILAALRLRGMSHAQASEALEADVRDLQLNLRSRLTQDSSAKAFPGSSRNVHTQDTEEGAD
ncbi:MAG TPA: sigma-70 family RNA polymerase sigma factor [Terriglobales bacterium]|jgi:RNA polymerase sigma-70 factor (ECF subfamily)|nr:sigma-70 family RNA polymerase sigma factor [Terriglobales bacterium]